MTPQDAPAPALNRAGRRLEARRGRKLAALGSGLVLASSGAATVALATGSQMAGADTLTVMNLDPDGTDSLHDLVEGASAGDVIVFDPSLSGTITLTDDIDVPTSVTIQGPGAGVVTVSGDDSVRIFDLTNIAPTPATFTVSGLTLTAGSGTDGAAILTDEEVDITLTDMVVTDNQATENGGAIASDGGGSIRVVNSQFTGNESDDGGGAIWFIHGSTFESTDSTFADNQAVADQGWGGALYLYDIDTSATISGSEFTGNSSRGSGGAITFWNDPVPFVITDSTFTGNSSGVDDAEGLVLRDSTVSGNSAGNNGGGLYLWGVDTEVQITNSTISGNTALSGGGIHFSGYYGLSVVQSTVTQNSASRLVGGIRLVDIDFGSVEHANSGGASRRPGNDGAAADTGSDTPSALGLLDPATRVDLVGTILWGNVNGDLGEEGSATSDHSLLGTVTGTTAVTDAGGTLTGVDPLLGPLQDNGGPTQTHALLDGSPAINTGPDPVPDFPGNADDQRGAGYPRVVGGRVDIGAFEVQPVSIEPDFTG